MHTRWHERLVLQVVQLVERYTDFTTTTFTNTIVVYTVTCICLMPEA